MKVRATRLGFWGGKRRREGDVFDVPETVRDQDGVERAFALGKWMEPVAEEPPAPAEPPHGGAEGRAVGVRRTKADPR